MQQTWHRRVAVKFSASARRSPKVGGGAHKFTAATRRGPGPYLKTAILFVFFVFSHASPPQAPPLLHLFPSPPLLPLSFFFSFSPLSSPPPRLIIILLLFPPPFLLFLFSSSSFLPPLFSSSSFFSSSSSRFSPLILSFSSCFSSHPLLRLLSSLPHSPLILILFLLFSSVFYLYPLFLLFLTS